MHRADGAVLGPLYLAGIVDNQLLPAYRIIQANLRLYLKIAVIPACLRSCIIIIAGYLHSRLGAGAVLHLPGETPVI